MEFSPSNNIVKRCIQGMDMEEKARLKKLANCFCKVGTKQQITLKNFSRLIM